MSYEAVDWCSRCEMVYLDEGNGPSYCIHCNSSVNNPREPITNCLEDTVAALVAEIRKLRKEVEELKVGK